MLELHFGQASSVARYASVEFERLAMSFREACKRNPYAIINQ